MCACMCALQIDTTQSKKGSDTQTSRLNSPGLSRRCFYSVTEDFPKFTGAYKHFTGGQKNGCQTVNSSGLKAIALPATNDVLE